MICELIYNCFELGNQLVMADMVFGDDPSCGIKKRILHASKFDLPSFPDGTKVTENSVKSLLHLLGKIINNYLVTLLVIGA